jgi:hypothetical protein
MCIYHCILVGFLKFEQAANTTQLPVSRQHARKTCSRSCLPMLRICSWDLKSSAEEVLQFHRCELIGAVLAYRTGPPSRYNKYKFSFKFTPQETHYVSAIEPNRLMLFGESVAVYCENHTEHTNTVRTSQETYYNSATEPNRLMLFGESVAVC